jgi:hypothetical protein
MEHEKIVALAGEAARHAAMEAVKLYAAEIASSAESPERKEFIRSIFLETLDEWAEHYGMDVENPRSQQADFAHLRKWRLIVEKTGLKAGLTAMTLLITGAVATLWLGIQVAMKH